MTRKYSHFLALTSISLLLGAAPAWAEPEQAPAKAESSVWDPFERINRATYYLNSAFTGTVSGPVITAYRENIPVSIRTGISNVFTNLREPLTFVSSGVQGDLRNMRISAGRFAINTIAGIGGVFDVATQMEWVSRPEDLGTAMCSYGVPSGPYLVVPFFGPSNLREAAGTIAAYGLAYTAMDDWTVGYVIADRYVAAASDRPMSDFKLEPEPQAATVDAYAATRERYAKLRTELCADSIPAAELKASPLGSVVRKVN